MLNSLIYSAKVFRTLFVSDEQYLKKRFIKKLGYIPNFKKPNTFNEKVTARMIFDRCPFYTILADKFAVRELMIDRIGEQYLVPLVGLYSNFDEIQFESLPHQFVLKCTHDSGSALICTNKESFNIDIARAKTNKCLSMNMYYRKREWHYKNIKPRILIENYINLYMDQASESIITTCRVHCFEGQPEFVEIDVKGVDGVDYSNMYNTSWQLQPFTVDYKKSTPYDIQEPKKFKKMIELAEKLAFKYGYSRVDFLLTENEVYFSEITLTPNAGRMVIEPKEWDEKLGKYWKSN